MKLMRKFLIFAIIPAAAAFAETLPAVPPPASQALQQLQQLQQTQTVPAAAAAAPAPTGTQLPPLPGQVNNQSDTASPSAPQSAPSVPAADASSSAGELFQVEDPDTDDAAFQSVTSRLFPLTPDQILHLHRMYNASELAQVAYPGTPPRPTATSQFVNLAPGSTPPVIRLAQGFVSSLVFLDSTGAPWPIVAYDLGDPKAFNIQWDKSGNTLMIQANQMYTYANLAVRLEGLNTPVMMTLIPGQKAVDYRVDLRIQGYGPNAKMTPTGQNLPPHADNVLLSVLDGVPPSGSRVLDVVGGDAQIWEKGNKFYVRTRLNILSPGWVSSMTSADGMHVYEMAKTPVLLVSWHGKVMQLKVEGL